MYSIDEKGYIGRNPIRWYEGWAYDVYFRVKSDSVRRARYEAWLEYKDAYIESANFLDFMKNCRVVREGRV